MTVYNDVNGKPLRLHAFVRHVRRRDGELYRITRLFSSVADGTPWIDTVGARGYAVSRRTESVELVRYEDERCSVFGGAAARDDVRVDENGIYRPG